MNKLLGGLIVVGCVAAIGGVALFSIGYANSTDDTKLITNDKEVTETFSNFNVDLETYKIEFKKSTDGKNRVVSVEQENNVNDIKVENNTLSIKQSDNRPWYKKIFNFNLSSKLGVTVYLTNTDYENLVCKCHTGSINVNTGFVFSTITLSNNTGSTYLESSSTGATSINGDTGSINVKNMTASSLDIENDTGSINVSNVETTGNIKIEDETGSLNLSNLKCQNLEASTSTGSINISTSSTTEIMKVSGSTGSIRLDRVDCSSAKLKTSTGSINGTFLTAKIFSAKSSTGSVSVPTSTTGGLVEAETSTGSINLSIAA